MAKDKQPSSTTEVAAPQTTAVVPAYDYDPSEVGAGMEGADASSFAIPFFGILQKGSPQVDETAGGELIEGAKAGMFFSSVTKKLYDGKKGVVIVPCAYQRRFIRWGARGTDSSGFKGEMLPEAVEQLKAEGKVKELDGKLYFPLEDGSINEKKCDRLADVRNHFCIVVDEDTGAFESALLSLTSTQIKKSRNLMSALSAIKVRGPDGVAYTPATFSTQVRATTVAEQNDKGSWFGIKFDIVGPVTDPSVRAAAKALWNSVKAGTVAAKYEHMEDTAPSEGAGSSNGF